MSIRAFYRYKFIGIVFRLSIVSSLVAGIIDAVNIFSEHNQQKEEYQRALLIMKCASDIPRQWIDLNKNESGNIDIGKFGCGSLKRGEQFFTSEKEIFDFRSGNAMWIPWKVAYDLNSNVMLAIFIFLVVNIIGIFALYNYLLIRWVVFGSRRREE